VLELIRVSPFFLCPNVFTANESKLKLQIHLDFPSLSVVRAALSFPARTAQRWLGGLHRHRRRRLHRLPYTLWCRHSVRFKGFSLGNSFTARLFLSCPAARECGPHRSLCLLTEEEGVVVVVDEERWGRGDKGYKEIQRESC